MRIINWKISTGYAIAKHEGSFEVTDETTDDEINELVLEELWNRIDYSWSEI
jgi:uncharacterized protein CbrC (UPF0167 family)